MSCSFKYHVECFLLEYLFLLAMMSLTLGSLETVSEATCEYEDSNLIFRNKPAYSPSDVKAMDWYKGKYSPIASWSEGKGFVEYHPYIGRLMQIGETGIKIRRANRSDSGSYWLFLTLASVDNKLEAVTHLEVIVAPSSQCKPNITMEGSILTAELPSEECGTPHLRPKWKQTNNIRILELQNSSLLDLGSNSGSWEYMVCAEGDSAKCYNGNISDLCTGYTKSQHGRRDDGLKPDPVSTILLPVLGAIIGVGVLILVVIWLKRNFCSGNRQREQRCLTVESRPTDVAEACHPNEEHPLIENGDTSREAQACLPKEENLLIEKEETSRIAEACPPNEEYPLIEKGDTSREGLPKIQNYLRGLYKDMTSVSLSPTGKDNYVDVSEVYIDLEFQQIETRDFKYTENDLAWTTSYKPPVSKEDIHIVKAQNQNVSPIIIVGCNGCGKSTWCKHLVQCWSQNSKTEDANVHGINLPSVGEYQILLYLPLKSSDRGLSFQELLQHYLFQRQPEYLNIITKYMHDKIHAQSILILIDGFEIISEYVKPMSELFDHKLFSSCTVIFTCQPRSLKLIFNACVDSSIELELFKVCEIPLEKSKAYASKVLSRLSQQNKDFNIRNFLIFTRNLHVQGLLKLPYLCLTLLFVYMENRNPYIEITDILLRITEHVLDTAKTDQRCKEKIMNLSQRNSLEVHTSVNKLDERFVKIKDLMYELSRTTEEIFLSKTMGLADEERLARVTPARGEDKLCIEVLHEIGLVTESLPLKSNKGLSTLTFTNVLICQCFLSMAIAFKKGGAFDYIVSDMEVALKHSMIIHMLWQFSPTLGKEIFVEMRKLKTTKIEKLGLSQQTNKFRYFITKQSKGNKYHQVMWLQLIMYKGDLDDEKLLFLTNALRSMGSLTSLVLENNENNDDLVFWLPCSQTLKKLEINISNCTLLLCPEWNNHIPLNLQEVVIKSVIISSCDQEVLCKAFKSCQNIETLEMYPIVVSTDDFEIVS